MGKRQTSAVCLVISDGFFILNLKLHLYRKIIKLPYETSSAAVERKFSILRSRNLNLISKFKPSGTGCCSRVNVLLFPVMLFLWIVVAAAGLFYSCCRFGVYDENVFAIA